MYCPEHTFVLDIYCQQFENIYQLNILIGIGYILPTIGDISQLGSVCAPFWRKVGEYVPPPLLNVTFCSVLKIR